MPFQKGNKLGQMNKGKKLSEEQKTKIGLFHRGKKWRIGEKHSEESKQKMREASLRNGNRPPSRKGATWIMPEETKSKISQTLTGRKRPEISGDKCHLWKGGITPFYKIIRKIRLENAGGFHIKKEWETLKAQYNWTCPCCHKREPEIKLTEDHVVPIAKGGSDNIENIQPLCVKCNSSKNVKIIRFEYSLVPKE